MVGGSLTLQRNLIPHPLSTPQNPKPPVAAHDTTTPISNTATTPAAAFPPPRPKCHPRSWVATEQPTDGLLARLLWKP